MKYALSIDWLAFFCSSETGEIDTNCDFYEYEKQQHGTRQFRELWKVSKNKEEFAIVQQIPCSSALKSGTLIVKFANRFCYHVNLWYMIDDFMRFHKLTILNISRLDICADFNRFANNLAPITLIKEFLSSKFRHIGQGDGSAHFTHGSHREQGTSKSYLNYTGLSFGQNSSDSRCYLYNKTLELLEVHDKPYIRQLWQEIGLENTLNNPVWRLEVSIKSKGMKFRDKETGETIIITSEYIRENKNLSKLYHTFVKSLFSFIKNRADIKNVTREPRIELFNGEEYIKRSCIRNKDGGNRTERILIRQLWQMSETYRGREVLEDEGLSKQLAVELADSCDLTEWMSEKRHTWHRFTKK